MYLISFFYVCPLVIIREPCSSLGYHSVADDDNTTNWYIDTNVSVQLAASILRVAQEELTLSYPRGLDSYFENRLTGFIKFYVGLLYSDFFGSVLLWKLDDGVTLLR